MQLLIQASPLIDKLKHWHRAISFSEVQLTTSQKVVLWSIGVVGTSAVVVGVLSRYLARRRAKPIINPRIQRAINKRISRMRSPNGGMGSVASSGGRSSPLAFSERLSLASGSIGSGAGDAAPLSPQQLGVMGAMSGTRGMAPSISGTLSPSGGRYEYHIPSGGPQLVMPAVPVSLSNIGVNEEEILACESVLQIYYHRLAPFLSAAKKQCEHCCVQLESKYWFEWRHRCGKKAINVQKLNPDGSLRKFLPLNDLEVRVLELIGKRSVTASVSSSKEHDVFLGNNSDSEPLENIKVWSAPVRVKVRRSTSLSRSIAGMEALETSINYWEDALAAFSLGARGGVSGTLALTSPEEAEFCREIQDLLQEAYLLQERCELLFLDQRSVLFRSESGGAGEAEGAGGRRTRLLSTHTASSHTRREHHSSAESFASAEDQVADLRDFDDLTESLPELEHLELYQSAVKQFEIGIPYRTLRTEVVQCGSDAEFLCKLHCLRISFHRVFEDAAAWAWFVDAGRQVLTDLLIFADKEPKEFLVAYEEMVSWATDPANWSTIESELTSKGVKALTFYDVVLDYILLDAFEDLASPPSSVLAVVRNRWLSDRFKESALTTAVWSVIKAKRRYLQQPAGFMAHFYCISEHLLPVLVWGFLGPDERLRDMCVTFQAEIVGFITDLFSFHKCRYGSAEELAADIMQHARLRQANITDKLAERN